jgi:hypothetical protein
MQPGIPDLKSRRNLEQDEDKAVEELRRENPGSFTVTFDASGQASVECQTCRNVDDGPEALLGQLRDLGRKIDGYPEVAVVALRCRHPKDHGSDLSRLTGVLTLKPAAEQKQRHLYHVVESQARVPPAEVSETEKTWIDACTTAATKTADATKWLLGAAGAIATVLLAGIQFSDLGKTTGDQRNIFLLLSAIALLAVGSALWFASSVLISREIPLYELLASSPIESAPTDAEARAQPESTEACALITLMPVSLTDCATSLGSGPRGAGCIFAAKTLMQ